MYPNFLVPPYNDGKKYKTLLNQTPKTHILSANMYELEIIRLLHLLAPDNFVVKIMVEKTLERLKNTCFGYKDDGVGECFDASLVVLRFISTVEPNDYDWIQSRIMNFNRHYHDKKRSNYSMWYFWLCLSEMPFHIAKPEIEKHKAAMIGLLSSKSMVMRSESHKIIHPVLFCIIRNVLANYPEYTYITVRQPYIMERDGRLYFDLS